MAISGIGVAYVTGGFLLAWSGIRNITLKDELTSFLKGQNPPANPTGAPTIGVSGSSGGSAGTGSTDFATPSGSGSSSSGQQALKQAAHAYGWDTGAQWTALNYVEMREAGYSSTAKNPSSGALGLAQALGHGKGSLTQGSLGNEYGGYGLSDSQAKQANSGNAYWQAVWMVNYIHATYGNPVNAANHERAHNWY